MNPTRTEPSIEIEDLNHQFGDQMVLRDVAFSVPPGQLVCILGASGCGKSTLLRLIAGLEATTTGSLHRAAPLRDCGFVFQQPNLLPWRRVLGNVELPLLLRGVNRSERKAASLSMMQQMGLDERDARKWPRELSGGMQMRASLARTLVTSPRLLLFDEPFSALDEILRHRLNEDLRRWHHEFGWTTLFVTHHVAEAVFLADRIVMLRRPSQGLPSIADDIPINFPDRQTTLRESEAFLRQVATISRRFREIQS